MKCPACGSENIEGVDRCEECMAPFRDLDVPQAGEGLQGDLLLDPVNKIYSEYPAAVTPQDSVSHAVEIMTKWRAGCVPVLEDGRLAGILTEVDLLLKLPDPSAGMESIQVSQVMTRNPETIDESITISEALHKMSLGGYRHLPVLRQGGIVGILSVKDVIRYLDQHLR